MTRSFFEEARKIVSDQQVRFDAVHNQGICWSGMEWDRPKVETLEVVAERLRERAERAEAFKKSPIGRFYQEVHELQELGYFDEADRLEGLYRRDLADERQPLNTRAVGAAIAILTGLPKEISEKALKALSELLMKEGE